MQRRRFWRPAGILVVAALLLVTAAMLVALFERAGAVTVSISGTVHSADSQNGIIVTVYREVNGAWEWADSEDADAAGPAWAYAFYGLAPGNYKVEFQNLARGWLPEFYNNKRTIGEADVVGYDGTTPRTGIDCTFDPAPICIGGTVYTDAPAGSENTIFVTVYREVGGAWEWADSDDTQVAGPAWAYAFYGLPPGDYKVEFLPSGGSWLPEFYNNKRTIGEADVVAYDGTTPRTGIDCTFDPAPICIGGTVYTDAPAGSEIRVTVYREVNGIWQSADSREGMVAGPVWAYAFYGLPPGDYKVEFLPSGGSWLPEFYNNKRTIGEADVVGYDGTTPRTGIDCTLDRILDQTAVSTNAANLHVKYGTPVTLRSSLKRGSGELLPGMRLALQRSYNGSTWTTVTAPVSLTGSYSVVTPVYRKTYFRWVFGGADGFTPCISARRLVESHASVGRPNAPRRMRPRRRYLVFGTLKPAHRNGSSPILMQFQSYRRGRWRSAGSDWVQAFDYKGYSLYAYYDRYGKGSPRRWRARALHGDADHLKTYSAWEYYSVY